MLGTILIAGMGSLFICMFLGPKFIEFLRTREFGQQIREEGPAGHSAKAGTPTMGGLLIMVSVVVPFLILGQFDSETLAVVGTMLASAALGFADDWTKITRKRSLGVSGKTKLLVQLLIAIGLWYVATHTGHPHLSDTVRFRISDASVNIGYAYPVLIFLVLAGATNGVNLTDGLDGLAAGCSAIVLLAYTAMTFITTGQDDLALVCSTLVGACVGFLWFNSFPAAIFMGDTGSLGLGGAIAALAVMTKTEVLLLITGGIFVIEALSVLIQVIAFQRFRKRVFLMAPVHHHFELMAWSETKIILRFWIIAAISAAIGFTLYQQSIT
jgi:phospho-N-acetylmuramoyl-pentapeptide-transferase